MIAELSFVGYVIVLCAAILASYLFSFIISRKAEFGFRLSVVSFFAILCLLQWYPKSLDQDMVEIFRAKIKDGVDTTVIFDRLQKDKAKLEPGEKLSLDSWTNAIGESVDLRDIVKVDFQREVFPYLISEEGDENLNKKQKIYAEKAKRKTLKSLKLSAESWAKPTYRDRKLINREILKKIENEASGKIRLGLDLSGGVQFMARLQAKDDPDNPGEKLQITDGQVTRAMETIRARVDEFGVSEPIIQKFGTDSIIIQSPSLSQIKRERIRKIIETIAKLDFHLSHKDNDLLKQERGADQFDEQARLEFELGLKRRRVKLMSYEQEEDDGEIFTITQFIEEQPALSGKHIKSAYVARNDLTGVPEIHFELDSIGANKFAKITEAHRVGNADPRLLAIILDGKLISAPSINGRIHSRGQITGDFTRAEANNIASSLNNPLETPLKIEEERDVAPSLGKDSIAKGYKAAIWGLMIVAVFMLIYYLLSGVVANIALALNILILLGVLCWFDAALTLPGIAGVVLTIGMAVDANVLIFERIREELNVGKSLKGAIASGYDKAFGTIFDANITTMIASVILIYMGKGPVKGFGVTLTIGILASMFTALFVTRLVVDILLRAGIIGSEKSKRSMHLRPSANLPKFNFLKYAKPAFIASWALIIVGFGAGLLKGTDKMLGVDFAGGYSMLMKLDPGSATKMNDNIESGSFREQLSLATGIDGAQIQAQLQTEQDTREQKLRIDFPLGAADVDNAAKVEEHVKRLYGEASLERLKLDKVGPSVSGEIQKSALIAVMLAMFGILIYVAFRYEYSFAVGAVIAILHDVLMTGGWFFLSGRELNAPIVAAALTIIGFSINDTIVIFDRIRENLRMGTRGSFADVMNTALNQTLSRTIITSGTTLLSTATLYFFGGTVINDFAFTFLVGVITGTYSSIYIACAIVLWWHKGKRPELAAPTVDTDTVGVAAT